MIYKKERNYFDGNTIIGSGVEGLVFESNNKAVKVLRKKYVAGSKKTLENIDYYQNKLKKLEVLKEINSRNLPSIYDIYVCDIQNHKNVMWAYSMELLENNSLKRYNKAIISISEKKDIFKRVLRTIKVLNSLGIYHLDLKIENLYLCNNIMKIYDCDSVLLDGYKYDVITNAIDLFQKHLKYPSNKQLQNYTFMIFVLENLLSFRISYWNPKEIIKLLENLEIPVFVKRSFTDVINGHDINFEEILRCFDSNDYFIKDLSLKKIYK